MEYVLITRYEEFDGERPVRSRVIVGLGIPDELVGEMYDLAGTPCEAVEERCAVCISRGVTELYPADRELPCLEASSYAGISLVTLDGRAFGSLVAISPEPLSDPEAMIRRLSLLGNRFAVEIERRRRDARLDASEERYRALVDAMPDGLVVYQDGKIVFANPQAARLRGIPDPEELVGRPAGLGPGADPAAVKSYTGIKIVGERPGGRSVDCTASSIIRDGREAVQVIERDVSAKRHTERRMVRIFDVSPNAMAVIDAEGFALRVNHEMRKLIGIERVPSHTPLLSALPFVHAENVRGLIRRAYGAQETVWIEFSQTPNGGRPQSVRWIAYADPEDGSVTLGARDVTKEREAERRLRHAERTHTMAMIAGGLAHDLGNLFTAIGGHTHIAASKLEEDHPAREVFGDIEDVLAHAQELKESLQMLGGASVVAERPVDLCKIIRDAKTLLERIVGERAALTINIVSGEPVTVRADGGRLKQVLVNLVANARDAIASQSRTGGTIGVEVSVEGDEALLRITDDGPGIAEEVIDSIFEPFFTTRGRSSGTGLGLALCRAIVESHHGTLCAESEEGSGASFLIRLPLHRSVRPDPAGIDEGLDGVHVDIRLPAGQERDVLCAMLESAGAVTTAYNDTPDVILVCPALYKGALGAPCVVLDDHGGADIGDATVLQRPFVRGDLERALLLALRKPAGGGGGGDE